MTYQINRVKSEKLKVKSSQQAGVTLLLAILILSSILAISFSLAAVLFIEVRNAGDLLKTEPAFYAATGVGEQAFFDQERHACPDSGAGCYATQFANNVVLNGAPVKVSSSTPIFIDRVKIGATFNNRQNEYDFCDVSAGAGPCGYGKVKISYITTNSGNDPLYAYLCEFNPNGNYPSAPCTTTGTEQGYWKIPDDSILNGDGSFTMHPLGIGSVSWTLNPGLQQELILTNPGGNNDIYVQIETFGPDGTTRVGLPYVGKTAVSINTQNISVGRKIQVVVPNSSRTAGATSSQTVTEGGTASLTCASGNIISYTSVYGKNCTGGSYTCPVSCGSCTVGSSSCSVTYNNSICGDCAGGCVKNGDLSITCQ